MRSFSCQHAIGQKGNYGKKILDFGEALSSKLQKDRKYSTQETLLIVKSSNN